MLVALLAALTTAQAGHWKEPNWYVNPILTGGVVSVNGNTWVQASAGLQSGFRTRYKGGALPWMNHTRARAVGTYGITSGSLGADTRVGTFFGPAWKKVVFQHGPDLWYAGHGRTDSPDYFLRWSPGLDLFNGVTVRVVKGLSLGGEVVPGWALSPDRQPAMDLWIFDELRAGVHATMRVDPLRVTVGYTRKWNAAGEQGFVVFSAGVAL